MNNKAFTLVELVMIIALIGIIAAVAIPRMPDPTGVKATEFSDKLRADLRYAQNLAMTGNRRARVAFRAVPNGYDITLGGSAVTDPATGGPYAVTLNQGHYAGLTIAFGGFTGSYLEFNSLGVPYDGSGALSAGKSIVIAGGGAAITVTVQAQTGAVN